MMLLSPRNWWSVALILHYQKTSVLSATTTTSLEGASSSVTVDLSYQSDWKREDSNLGGAFTTGGDSKSSWFTKRLLDKKKDHLDDIFIIDVSSSNLGDNGLKQLNDAMVATLKDIEIQLDIRMNHLSSEGASFLFDSLSKDSNDNTLNSTTSIEKEEETPAEDKDDVLSPSTEILLVSSLDIGLNDLGFHDNEMNDSDDNNDTYQQSQRSFTNSLQNLIQSSNCPQTLRMDSCGLGPPTCRAIGKGILNRGMQLQKDEKDYILNSKSVDNDNKKLRLLYLSGNDDIGDAGTAALAAALRTVERNENNDPILDVLDLSSCGISDIGAEALAMAIQKNPNCIKNLNLSNNQISNNGAMSIARALLFNNNQRSEKTEHDRVPFMTSIDLSNNNIEDSGAKELAEALKLQCIKFISLRSCGIKAEGAAAFAKALCAIASSNLNNDSKISESLKKIEVGIDISGNHLGTFEIKKKKKGSSLLLSSKASTTAASYMNFMKKKLQTGLKDAGLDVTGVMGGFKPSAESDDDEEELMNMTENDGVGASKKKSTSRCGACSFADTIVEMKVSQKLENADHIENCCKIKCELGMRQCFLDKGAADALAAAIIRARKTLGIDLSIDTSMNTEFDKNDISVLRNKNCADSPSLLDMADRHMKAVEAMQKSRQRAIDANRAELQYDLFDDDDEFGIMGGSPKDIYGGDESYENNEYSDDYY